MPFNCFLFVAQYAVYNSYTRGSNHYGVIATMDVYGFSITQDQDSGAAIWVGNPGDGAPTSGNFILVGWHVSDLLFPNSPPLLESLCCRIFGLFCVRASQMQVKPRLYGDSNTHLFVYWTVCITDDA
jgi:hypothetical protein